MIPSRRAAAPEDFRTCGQKARYARACAGGVQQQTGFALARNQVVGGQKVLAGDTVFPKISHRLRRPCITKGRRHLEERHADLKPIYRRARTAANHVSGEDICGRCFPGNIGAAKMLEGAAAAGAGILLAQARRDFLFPQCIEGYPAKAVPLPRCHRL